VSGPRQELPCGCVDDTVDGKRTTLARCEAHRMTPGPDLYDASGQLVQRYVTMGDLVLPVRRMSVQVEPLQWQAGEDGKLLGPFGADGSPR